ncbi:STAS domain-containing protein [Carbonactinospora thermoautotrophica]|uniref:Anti-sigma factor antagonist n=1 Tax=Carbonactinospora thermoautotrophica TaxID=1469144 RepID=A0A132MUR9_9ACTN|nr:Anti-sigma F factor antagonist (spoIIAA-2) [Carbonactinospora thermoautotrophica]
MVDLPEEVDLVNIGEIEQALVRLVAAGHCRIVLNASRLDFIDSTGLSGLVRALSVARSQQGTVRFAHASPWTARVMRVAGLHRVLAVYDSVEEAVAD